MPLLCWQLPFHVAHATYGVHLRSRTRHRAQSQPGRLGRPPPQRPQWRARRPQHRKVLPASTQDRCIQSGTGRTLPFPRRRPMMPFLKVATAKYRKKTAAYFKTAGVVSYCGAQLFITPAAPMNASPMSSRARERHRSGRGSDGDRAVGPGRGAEGHASARVADRNPPDLVRAEERSDRRAQEVGVRHVRTTQRLPA